MVAPVLAPVSTPLATGSGESGALICFLCRLPVAAHYRTYEYALRVTTPVLMVNGRYDQVFRYETMQRPLFEALATPPEHKRHVVLESFHGLQDKRKEMIRTMDCAQKQSRGLRGAGRIRKLNDSTS